MSQSHRSEEALSSAPIGPLMFKLALPAVAAQLINMLYNIVDRIYIGHIPEVGRTALTGLGITFPILMLISAFTAFAGFDLVTASGNAKVVNLCSNVAAFVTFAFAGKIIWALGLPAACCSIAGHYVGSTLALKDGARIIRPMFFVVLALLLARILWDLAVG